MIKNSWNAAAFPPRCSYWRQSLENVYVFWKGSFILCFCYSGWASNERGDRCGQTGVDGVQRRHKQLWTLCFMGQERLGALPPGQDRHQPDFSGKSFYDSLSIFCCTFFLYFVCMTSYHQNCTIFFVFFMAIKTTCTTMIKNFVRFYLFNIEIILWKKFISNQLLIGSSFFLFLLFIDIDTDTCIFSFLSLLFFFCKVKTLPAWLN